MNLSHIKIGTRASQFVTALLVIFLAGCSTPATISMPNSDVLELRHEEIHTLADLPAPSVLIQAGDTLDIIRNSPFKTSADENRQYVVRPDGKISVPNAGLIQAAGLSPEALASTISEKFANIYREPEVTVNIIDMPGNRAFIGGAVRNPSAIPLNGNITMEQALLGSGGLLPTADSEHVALVRVGDEGKYNVYFLNLRSFLEDPNRPVVALQRGDMIFVPKSGIGSTVEAVDLYITRMIPFNLGIGASYDLNDEN